MKQECEINFNSKNYKNSLKSYAKAREKRRRSNWWIRDLQELIRTLFILKLTSLFFLCYKDFQNINQIFHLPNNNSFQFYTHNLQKIFPQFSIWEKKKWWLLFGVCGPRPFFLFFLSFFLVGKTQREYGCSCNSSSFLLFLWSKYP